MSAAQILAELPKLDDRERRAIRQRLWELETQRQEMEFAAATADLAFQHLDQMEAEDARTATR
jgi:acyl dehydratase